MSVDYIATSLTVHGAICLSAGAAVWKLGGESKFGTEKIAELHALSRLLLQEISDSLEQNLDPILIKPGVTESIELDEFGMAKSKPARLSVTGKEDFKNAVSAFVKSKNQDFLAFREASQLCESLTNNLSRLRTSGMIAFAGSLLACSALVAAKFDWVNLDLPWVHFVAYILVGTPVIVSLFFVAGIIRAANNVDTLKNRYAHLY